MDDDFFAVVMQDEKAFEVMLRILTQRDDLHVIKVRTQYNLRNLVGHSVVLDGFAEGSQGKLYNNEVQVENNDYHPKRVRYYQSNIDISMLEKGKKYSELPDVYLIFISAFDIFKLGRNTFSIKRMRELETANLILPQFDEKLWRIMVENMTVGLDGEMLFKFRNGMEITVK